METYPSILKKTIDLVKLKEELKRVSLEIREGKKALRQWYRDQTQPFPEEAKGLAQKRAIAHALCTITAHSRNRVHLKPSKTQLILMQDDLLQSSSVAMGQISQLITTEGKVVQGAAEMQGNLERELFKL